jgi:hypothetical protein
LDSEDSYIVLDLLQRYINSLIQRKSSKRKAYSVVRSFFAHNRCALPPDPSFRIRGNIPPVQSRLSRADVYEVLLGAELRYRSMILFKWQSLIDNERLINRLPANCVVNQSLDPLGSLVTRIREPSLPTFR